MSKIALLALALVFAACASSPVGVSRIDPSDVHRRLTRSALSAKQLSPETHNVLLEANLDVLFDDDPEKALERLHDLAVSGSGGPPQLFAVAEASFLHAERTGKRPYYLATALYAWAYLVPEDATEAPSPFDPRFRLAANLYNRGLTSALETGENRQVALKGGTLDLPFGQLDVAFDPTQLVWQGRRMTGFAPIAEFRVFGLQAHYREPGLGAPMAASLAPLAGENQPKDLLRAELTLPVTALLRSPRSRTALAWPPLASTLEVHVPDAKEAIEIAGRRVPFETEPTAVLAYSLADSPIWEQELSRFFAARSSAQGEQSEATPHRGNSLTVGRFAEWGADLIRDFVKAPVAVTRALTELATKRDVLVLASADATPRMMTSIDQMNPRNKSLRTLAEIPIAPGVAANSIIAVKGSGPVEEGGDGVVDYRSAHLDDVQSELVVQSGHSLQDHPETVEEVRRILLYHARDAP